MNYEFNFNHMKGYYGLVLIMQYFSLLSNDLFEFFYKLEHTETYNPLLSVSYIPDDDIEKLCYFKNAVKELQYDPRFIKMKKQLDCLGSDNNSIWEENLEVYKREYYDIANISHTLELLKIHVYSLHGLWLYIANELVQIRKLDNNILQQESLYKEHNKNSLKVRALADSLNDLENKFNKLLDEIAQDDEYNPDKNILANIERNTGCSLERIIERDGVRIANELAELVLNEMKKHRDDYESYSFFHEFVETVQNADSDYWGLSGRWYPRDEETSDMESDIRGYISKVIKKYVNSSEDKYVLSWLGRHEEDSYEQLSLIDTPTFEDMYTAVFKACWEKADSCNLDDEIEENFIGLSKIAESLISNFLKEDEVVLVLDDDLEKHYDESMQILKKVYDNGWFSNDSYLQDRINNAYEDEYKTPLLIIENKLTDLKACETNPFHDEKYRELAISTTSDLANAVIRDYVIEGKEL